MRHRVGRTGIPDDLDALNVGVAHDENSHVHIHFGAEVKWIVLPEEQAADLAIRILEHAGYDVFRILEHAGYDVFTDELKKDEFEEEEGAVDEAEAVGKG